MELTLESIDIIDIKESGHGEGYDKYGNFTSSHIHHAKLNIKEKNVMIPIGFIIYHGYANPTDKNNLISIQELNYVSLTEMKWSYYTDEAKQAQEEAQKIFKENNIDEKLLEVLVIQKLSFQYNISEELRKNLQAYNLNKDLNKELDINSSSENKLKL